MAFLPSRHRRESGNAPGGVGADPTHRDEAAMNGAPGTRFGGGSAAGGGGEAVAVHDFAEGFGVGRASGGDLEEGGDLAEVGGAEDAGRDNGEGSGGRGGEVVEAVDDAAGDDEGVTGGGFVALGFARGGPEGEGERAFEGVTGFFVGVVAVGDGDFGSGGDGELEHGERGWGGGAVNEVADGEAGETNLFVWGCGHRVGLPGVGVGLDDSTGGEQKIVGREGGSNLEPR
jgi:ATP-dependent RNA helicase RhlE